MIKTDFESQLEKGLAGIGCKQNGIHIVSPQKGIQLDKSHTVVKRWTADYGDMGLIYLLGIDVPYKQLKYADMEEVQAHAAAAVELSTAKERIRLYRNAEELEHIKTIDAIPDKQFCICNNDYGPPRPYDPMLMSMIIVNRLLRDAKLAAK